MPRSNKQRDPIPDSFDSVEGAAEFWDTHSTADYDDQMQEVEFQVALKKRTFLVPVEGQLAGEIAALAERQGLKLETLVNLWLCEKAAAAAG